MDHSLWPIMNPTIDSWINFSYSVQKLVEKIEHYKIFWENAELNCRLEKRPLPEELDDGSFTGFDYSLSLFKATLNQNYSDTITSWTKSNPKRIQ